MSADAVPDAELVIAPGCPHCPAVLAALSELLKLGQIGQLQIANLALRPDFAASRGVRSVPWIRIGPFELTGAHTRAELTEWAQRASDPAGKRTYLEQQLEQGQLDTVIAACLRQPALLQPLLALAADIETPFAVRIGVGAVIEDLGPRGHLANAVKDIAQLLGHSEHQQIRADAAHFLGLSGSTAAIGELQRLLQDGDAEVREIAADSLEILKSAPAADS